MRHAKIVLSVSLLSAAATLFGWGMRFPDGSSLTQNQASESITHSSEQTTVIGEAITPATVANLFPQTITRHARTGAASVPRPGNASATLSSQTSTVPQTEGLDITPKSLFLIKSRRSFDGDVRTIPQGLKQKVRPERPEHEPPDNGQAMAGEPASLGSGAAAPTVSAPAPTPTTAFEGIHYTETCTGGQCGDGHPPDTNGDVGPVYYIETVNTAIGIYNKSTGARVAGFTFNSFMSQGSFGNLCDSDNFGDPVVVYDTFTDRWIITDFAFQVDAHDNISPQTVYQCFAVSKNGDPVGGGWNYYSILISGGIDDYPKFGIWPDGLYMSANMFGYSANASFQNSRAYAFNKAQMYAGNATVQVVSFDAPSKTQGTSVFTLLPSNARVQAGTPPTGRENLFASVWGLTNAVRVWKFHVDWSNTANSTFIGPTDVTTSTTWASPPSLVPEKDGNNLDTLEPRLMMQNQYTNIGGTESLWASHTVQGSSNSQAAVRWYQLNVSGGTINATAIQAATWNPDARNRWLPSLAVDRAGNMAIGYSVSDATIYPAIRYAGRLSTDTANTLSQTETSLIEGTGAQTQVFSDGSLNTRWGDYSAMTLDPDGCTFWYTNMYYVANGADDHTRIGSFRFSQCTPLANGTLRGTVTRSSDSAPINGATVTVGSDTATTNSNGLYEFPNYPVGTYTVSASAPGYSTAIASGVMVTANNITTQNFTLAVASASACLTDTTQADFQVGTSSNIDLTSNPGSVTLASSGAVLDQQNTTVGNTGQNITTTTWEAQSFVPGVSGQMTQVDVDLFCSSCSGTNPDIAVEIRTTSGGAPTNTVLASATIPGFSSGTGQFYSATFNASASLTAGTTYAAVLRLTINRTTGTYAWLRSNNNQYANGAFLVSTNSGANWTSNNQDFGFKTYVSSGYSSSGNLVSSLKDANPATGAVATWTTLSWTNAALPSGTGLQFQVAASNNTSGPFNFVGPDGTSGTFFTTSGASLSQFVGLRYLKYKAYLNTSNPSNAPTLNDVTVCFDNATLTSTSMAVNAATGTYGGTTNLSATLTAGGNGVSGKTINFTLNGSPVGSAPTNGSGFASLSSVSLSGIGADTYPTGVAASFAGDSTYASSGSTNSLTVNKADQTIAVNTHAPVSAAYNSQFTVAATADSGQAVSYSSSGVCTNNGAAFTMTSGVGTCTVKYNQAGDNNYNPAAEVTESVSATKATSGTAVSSSANPSNYGDQVTFTATVSSGAGTPSGTVQFKDGANNLGSPVSLVSGQAQISTSTLSPGTHTIAANFGGDNNFANSTGSLANDQVVRSAQIAVEQPAGSDLVDGTSVVDFGGVAPNATNSHTFIIRNDGTANLTGLAITFDGTNSGDFSVTANPTPPVAPAGSTSFTVQFAPSATGPRSAALHIASNDPNTSSFDVGLTGTGYTYLQAWRVQYFGSPDNSGTGADLNDFDNDGVPNLMEFATGTDPTQANIAPGSPVLNGAILEFTYSRTDAAVSDGLIFSVEWTNSLSLADWSSTGVSELILSDNGTIQVVKASVSAGSSGTRFLHLKVTPP